MAQYGHHAISPARITEGLKQKPFMEYMGEQSEPFFTGGLSNSQRRVRNSFSFWLYHRQPLGFKQLPCLFSEGREFNRMDRFLAVTFYESRISETKLKLIQYRSVRKASLCCDRKDKEHCMSPWMADLNMKEKRQSSRQRSLGGQSMGSQKSWTQFSD